MRRKKPASVVEAVRKKKLPLPGAACWWCWLAQPDRSTIIGDQIREIFQLASGHAAADDVADGVSPKRETVSKLRAVLIAGPNEIGSDNDDGRDAAAGGGRRWA